MAMIRSQTKLFKKLSISLSSPQIKAHAIFRVCNIRAFSCRISTVRSPCAVILIAPISSYPTLFSTAVTTSCRHTECCKMFIEYKRIMILSINCIFRIATRFDPYRPNVKGSINWRTALEFIDMRQRNSSMPLALDARYLKSLLWTDRVGHLR